MQLHLKVTGQKAFNEETSEIFEIPDTEVILEHSLWTISKWERKYKKSFIDSKDKTDAQMNDYIKMMIVNDVPSYMVNFLSKSDIEKIGEYLNDPMTATTFREDPNQSSYHSEKITAELIYYWMISNQIPIEFEHWHLNRLIALLRVFSVKNSPPKKRSAREIMASNAALNAQRRKALNSRG